MDRSALILSLLALLAIPAIISRLVWMNVLSFQVTIIVLVGVAVFGLLFYSDTSRWFLFLFGALTIMFGHRGVYLGTETYVMPFQIILWLLFASAIVYALTERQSEHVPLPPAMTWLTVWTVFTSGVFVATGQSPDAVVRGVSGIILGYPTFYVVRAYVNCWDRLRTMLSVLMLVSLLISVFGIFEYYFPQEAGSWFPWFFRPLTIVTAEGFERAAFSFWGYPAAASVVVWGVIIGYHWALGGYQPGWHYRLAFPTIIAGLIAVYISGQRTSWIGLGLGIAALGLFYGPRGWFSSAMIFLVILPQLPELFWERAQTIGIFATTGVPIDTSSMQRIARWNWGWQTMLANPFTGVGYGHWLTHNVFLEIGSSMGILPAALFLLLVIQAVIRLIRATLWNAVTSTRKAAQLFLALSITWVLHINVETAFFVLPFSAPLWLLIALGWQLSELSAAEAPNFVQQTHIKRIRDIRYDYRARSDV